MSYYENLMLVRQAIKDVVKKNQTVALSVSAVKEKAPVITSSTGASVWFARA